MFHTLSVPKGYGKLALPGGRASVVVPTTPSFGARPVAANAEFLSIADASQTGLDRGTTDFSAGFWFYPDAIDAIMGLMTKKATAGATQEAGWGINVDTFERRQLFFCDGSAAPITHNGSAGEFAAGNLYLIIMTFDRDGNMTSAINGGARTSTSIAAQTGDINNAAAFQIGKNYSSGTQYASAGFSCAFVYDGLLSEANEDTLYNGGSPLLYSAVPAALQAGMVSYWNFDEESDGSGAVTRLDSVGDNDLTDNNTTPSSAFPFE